MRFLALLLCVCAFPFLSPPGAQAQTWLQIEAQPNLNTALDRARAYAALFPDVGGFKLGNGWYGIALGPASKDEAAARLLDLRRKNQIPADSYLADGANYGQRFWPVGVDQTAPTVPEVAVEPAVEPAAEPAAPVVEPDQEETLQQSRAAEAALTTEERQSLQQALQWYGFYDGALDGSFGRGTRGSIADWQAQNGYEPTGVLATQQAAALMQGYTSDQAEFGFQAVNEAESGIQITLPMALIAFDGYEPPFVHYVEKNGSGLKVLLISEPGGKAGLKGLYDVLQTLEIVPAQGDRALNDTDFSIRGRNDTIETLVYAQAVGSNIKGYLISWNRSDAERMTRVLPAVQSSFRSLGDAALDPGLVPLSDAARRGLLAGLDVRHPKFSRSGFFIDTKGTILTTAEAVTGCGKIVVERTIDAKVAFVDAASGMAVLTPTTPLSPGAVARFATNPARLGAKASVSGYAYEDRLPAPVITAGIVEANEGLNGEPGLTRLTLRALPGDIGGPVLDATGSVVGMLMPANAKSGQQLPDGVAFAASSAAIGALMSANGITTTTTDSLALATPDALAGAARGMTVLISCWE